MVLVSPGTEIRINDESAYSTSGPGTVPLVVMALHANKVHPSGNGYAEASLLTDEGKLWMFSSQRELLQTCGYPKFYKDDIGTPLHGYELNEYGLHAAYQYLNRYNRLYALIAPIDMGQLLPRSTAPNGSAIAGSYWLDTRESNFGVFVSDGGAVPGSAWQSRSVRVVDSISETERVLHGTVAVADPTSTTFITGSLALILNGVTMTITGTMQSVMNTINTAGIPNISASLHRISETTVLTITNTAGGEINLNGSAAAALTQTGLNGFGSLVPKSTIGAVGDFAVVVTSTDNIIYQKLISQDYNGYPDGQASARYYAVGSSLWKAATPTVVVGTTFNAGTIGATDSIRINGVSVVVGGMATVADLVIAINAATIPHIVASEFSATQLRLTNTTGGDILLENENGVPLTSLGLTGRSGNRLFYSSHTQYPSGSVPGDVWVKMTEFNSGAKWAVKYFNGATGRWATLSAPLVADTAIQSGETAVQADDRRATAIYGGSLAAGVVYVRCNLYGVPGNPVASAEIRRYNGVAWEPLAYMASTTEPVSQPAEGTYWYSENFKVDIMVNVNGSAWVGYRRHPFCALTDAGGPFVQASAPTSQRNGNPLRQNDLWIDTSDLENYPRIYRYQEGIRKWTLVDNTDQTTPDGIVFDDARENSGVRLVSGDTYTTYSTNGSDLALSNYVDPDCVDPRNYPDGTLLFNTRLSTLNVKEWKPDYFGSQYDGVDYTVDGYTVGDQVFAPLATGGRWVTVSGKRTDGSPYMGRKAQRAMVVQAIQASVVNNQDIRAENLNFNIIAAPGYVELLDELVSLNADRRYTSFIVGDTPARLKPTAQAIQAWVGDGTVAGADEDHMSIADPYVGLYYPWGLSTNYDGAAVMIPPSSMAMQVIAKNDTLGYQWSAPAGFTRGKVDGVSSVGYLTEENEFRAAVLSQGQRDVLYLNNINPIAYFPNRGFVAYGQKTRNSLATALDRINVARLINYLRVRCDELSSQFLNEPNTQYTRDAARITYERLLSSLMAQDAVYDFVVVCDDTNNTPDRIDRNELWIDILIQPVKTIEFIIIPITIRNTGESLEL